MEEILKHIKHSKKGKLHLRFGKEERKKLRDGLLKDWKYAKHYVDSAINSVIGLVKGWISLYNGGRAKSEPEITRKTVYVKTSLFSVKNGKIRITIVPRRRYLEIDLTRFDYLPKDHDAIDGLLLTEDCLIITFKRKVELVEPKDYAAFDVNLKNITGFINGKIVKYDLRELYHIHRVYE
ncbi:MAG: RNA-guided endonuclease InsQ/TnpB family protein, partial [Candidatus Baldrarchaeia archaeon]